MDHDAGTHTFRLELQSRPNDTKGYTWRAAVHGLADTLERQGVRVEKTAAGPWTEYLELRLKLDASPGTRLLDGLTLPVTTRVLLRPHGESTHDFNRLIVLVDVEAELLRQGIRVRGAEPRSLKGDKKSPPAIRVRASGVP